MICERHTFLMMILFKNRTRLAGNWPTNKRNYNNVQFFSVFLLLCKKIELLFRYSIDMENCIHRYNMYVNYIICIYFMFED